MKDLFKGAQEVQQGFLQNPFSLAGLMMGRGHGNLSFSDALTQSAATIREQEQTRINAMEQDRRRQAAAQGLQEDERKRMVLGQLAQAFQANPNITDREALQLMYENGIKPTEAELKTFRPQYHPITGDQTNAPMGQSFSEMNASAGVPNNPASNPNSNMLRSGNGIENTPVGRKLGYTEELAERKETAKETRNILNDSAAEAKLDARKLATIKHIKSNIPKFYQGTGSEAVQGVNKLFNTKSAAAYEDFIAKASDLVLDIAQTQKGAQSDSDMARMEATKPNANNTAAGNISIAEGLEALYTRGIEYNKAKQKFVKQGGTPAEFDTRWSQYVTAFPIIEDSASEDGVIKVNKKNLKNWDVVFDPNFEQIIAGATPLEGAEAKAMDNAIQTPWGSMTREELEKIAGSK